uniref:Uncharacterized protein n=1 Tax=Nelumbo nucifera TaxID=4432 RepID=A0A822Z417_NELNU|nr:TPA_asm: hypothetical protein HUJ06_008876 [Nelumbo nucifera]
MHLQGETHVPSPTIQILRPMFAFNTPLRGCCGCPNRHPRAATPTTSSTTCRSHFC